MLDRLLKVKKRYEEITALLSDPSLAGNQEKFRDLSREHSQLTPVMQAFDRYQKAKSDLDGIREIVGSPGDSDLRQLAYDELDAAKTRVALMEEELKVLLIPKDPNDSRNVIVEIRAGTGGEEAALFGADLYRMYSRHAEKRGWKVEVLDLSEAGMGGDQGNCLFTGGRRRVRLHEV